MGINNRQRDGHSSSLLLLLFMNPLRSRCRAQRDIPSEGRWVLVKVDDVRRFDEDVQLLRGWGFVYVHELLKGGMFKMSVLRFVQIGLRRIFIWHRTARPTAEPKNTGLLYWFATGTFQHSGHCRKTSSTLLVSGVLSIALLNSSSQKDQKSWPPKLPHSRSYHPIRHTQMMRQSQNVHRMRFLDQDGWLDPLTC